MPLPPFRASRLLSAGQRAAGGPADRPTGSDYVLLITLFSRSGLRSSALLPHSRLFPPVLIPPCVSSLLGALEDEAEAQQDEEVVLQWVVTEAAATAAVVILYFPFSIWGRRGYSNLLESTTRWARISVRHRARSGLIRISALSQCSLK